MRADLQDMMAAERQAAISEVQRQLAWESDVAATALQKLRDFFMGDLETERVVVHAIGSPDKTVSSFRTVQLPADVQVGQLE